MLPCAQYLQMLNDSPQLCMERDRVVEVDGHGEISVAAPAFYDPEIW